jgi:hypothetical protein
VFPLRQTLNWYLWVDCSPDNFAKLFRPKAALFNKVLEVTIDDICYVSYPTPCADAESTDPHYPGDLITLFNVVIAVVRESSLRRVLGSSYDEPHTSLTGLTNVADLRRVGCDPLTAAMGLRDGIHPISCNAVKRVVEAFCKSLFHQEKRYKYVTKQVAIMFKVHENSPELAELLHTGNLSSSMNSMNSIASSNAAVSSSSSVVLGMVHNTNNSTSSLSSANSNIDIPTQGSAVLNEEMRNRDVGGTNNFSVASTAETTAGGDGSATPATPLNTYLTEKVDEVELLDSSVGSTNAVVAEYHNSLTYELLVMELMLQKSSLANEIRNLYHGLIGGHSVNLTVNGVISINIQLQDFSEPVSSPTWNNGPRGSSRMSLGLSNNSINGSDSTPKPPVTDTAEARAQRALMTVTPSLASPSVASGTANTNETPSEAGWQFSPRRGGHEDIASAPVLADTALQPFQTILLIADSDILSMIMLGTLDPSHYYNAYQHWSISQNGKAISPSSVITPTAMTNYISTLPSVAQGSLGNSSNTGYGLGSAAANVLGVQSGNEQYVHPTILHFVQFAKPTMSFLEISNGMGLPLEEVRRYLGTVRIICLVVGVSRFIQLR